MHEGAIVHFGRNVRRSAVNVRVRNWDRAQVREMEEVSGFSLVGILGMLIAVVVAVAKVLRVQVEDYQPTQLIHRPESVRITLVAVMDIVFTYGGISLLDTPTLFTPVFYLPF